MNDVLFCLSYNVGATTGSSKDLNVRHELPLVGMKVDICDNGGNSYEFSVRSTGSRSFNLVAK